MEPEAPTTRRGFENTYTHLTGREVGERLDRKNLRQRMRECLPGGRAIDEEDLRIMLDEGSQNSKAIVLRKRLLARAGPEYAGNLILSAVELQAVMNHLDGKKADGSPYKPGEQRPYLAPIREWQ